ncbi:hypothetical protein [Alkalibacterium sp.]|nr:MAG: hypothetical protein EA249_00680 [Alkalibacterium sp.]
MNWIKKAAGWLLLMLGTLVVLALMVLAIIGLFNNRIQFAQSNHEVRESQRIEEILDARLEPPVPEVQSVEWEENHREGQVLWKDDVDRRGRLSFSLDDSLEIEFSADDLNSYPLNEHLTYFRSRILNEIETQ